ncbi:MAG: helix-hairpin-helix domain-containing protein [Endomicrobia bacterium]|nr:helix-hairpin-helix domain-containing protein [Endomicrobiia bacterium]MDW8056444.1 helix-hairpin-helix domain-containing protein [Elusimicrobiota bacterium]
MRGKNLKLLFFILFLWLAKKTLFAVFEYKEIFANTGGLCGAFSSDDRSPAVIYYNPAGVFNIPKYGFYFSNTNLYGMPKLANNVFSGVLEIKSLGKIGLLYNSFGFELYKENLITVVYANDIAEKVSIGIGVKSLGVDVKNYGSKNFVSYDIGVLSIINPKIYLGFVVKDFNMPEITVDEKVYHTVIVTGQIRPLKDVKTYIDILRPTDTKIFARVGQEVGLKLAANFSFKFRAGVETVTENKPSKYSVGFGLVYKQDRNEFILDYSYLVHSILGGQHLVSLGLSFNTKEEKFVEELPRRRRTVRRTEQPAEMEVTPRRTTKKQPPAKPININAATVEELTQLPGIGPSTAQKIVEYRQQIGKFTSIDQLLDVPRIGRVTLERIKPYITVGEVTPEKVIPEVEKATEPPKPEEVQEQKVAPSEPEEELPPEELEEVPIEEKIEPELVPGKTEPSQQPVIVSTPTPKVVQEEITKIKKINLNTVSEKELVELGFSTLSAKNILRYRTRFGKFKSVDELYRIPQVDRKVIDTVKHLLYVE